MTLHLIPFWVIGPATIAVVLVSIEAGYQIGMFIARGYLASTPRGLWLSLYALLVMSMFAIGYQTAVAGSRRAMATFILTISFTLVFLLLTALEEPRYGFFHVNQQPLINVQETIMRQNPPK